MPALKFLERDSADSKENGIAILLRKEDDAPQLIFWRSGIPALRKVCRNIYKNFLRV